MQLECERGETGDVATGAFQAGYESALHRIGAGHHDYGHGLDGVSRLGQSLRGDGHDEVDSQLHELGPEAWKGLLRLLLIGPAYVEHMRPSLDVAEVGEA